MMPCNASLAHSPHWQCVCTHVCLHLLSMGAPFVVAVSRAVWGAAVWCAPGRCYVAVLSERDHHVQFYIPRYATLHCKYPTVLFFGSK